MFCRQKNLEMASYSFLQKRKKRQDMYSFDGEEDTETSEDDAVDEDTAPPGTAVGKILVVHI